MEGLAPWLAAWIFEPPKRGAIAGFRRGGTALTNYILHTTDELL